MGHYEFNIGEDDYVDDGGTLMKFISLASMIIFIILSTIIKLSSITVFYHCPKPLLLSLRLPLLPEIHYYIVEVGYHPKNQS